MRFKAVGWPGDKQTLSWFAFRPVQIGRDRRWLEWVTVEREVTSNYGSSRRPNTVYHTYKLIRFIEDPTRPGKTVLGHVLACLFGLDEYHA